MSCNEYIVTYSSNIYIVTPFKNDGKIHYFVVVCIVLLDAIK